MNRARNADHAARTCERFVYSITKITRLYDYQTVSCCLQNVADILRTNVSFHSGGDAGFNGISAKIDY